MRVEETILILGKVARAFFADEREGFGTFATLHCAPCQLSTCKSYKRGGIHYQIKQSFVESEAIHGMFMTC